MSVLLILVMLSGKEDEGFVTAKFENLAACETAATAMFEEVATEITVGPYEGGEEAAIMDEMLAAWGKDGELLGMFSCAPLPRN